MTIHYNRESEKVNRRKLRRASTEAENILWEYLKNRRFLGLKFKRQYSIDHFVIDFFCSELKFAIELDGKIHLVSDVKNHDENRDAFLNDFGIKIIRIKNEEVFNNIEVVLELIKENIMLLKQTSPKSLSADRQALLIKERTFKSFLPPLSFIKRGGEVK